MLWFQAWCCGSTLLRVVVATAAVLIAVCQWFMKPASLLVVICRGWLCSRHCWRHSTLVEDAVELGAEQVQRGLIPDP